MWSESSDRVEVRFGSDGDTIEAEVRGIRPVERPRPASRSTPGRCRAGVKPLRLADSSDVKVGDIAIAIGNPFGLDRTATEGIVSGVGREIQAPNGFSIDSVIQTDAPINPGNSGGPLLDDAARVIGVNSQIETGGSQGNVGIGFAVPSNTVREVVPALMRGEKIKRAYLGVADLAGVGFEPERRRGAERRVGRSGRARGHPQRRRDHPRRRRGGRRSRRTSRRPSSTTSPARRWPSRSGATGRPSTLQRNPRHPPGLHPP